MASYKVTILSFLSFLALSILILPSHAQNAAQDYVNCHNTPRTQVGVPGVTWNATLATYAQNYANSRMADCNLVHSGSPDYGENLAKGSNNATFYGTTAVNLWVAEKPYYDYATNACTGGKQCLHYTQVVWRNSLSIGCGRAICNNGGAYVVCNYYPPGNWVGEKPY